MATEANKLKVGAFLIGGFLVFNAALVWIGTSHLLERSERFVTYFDESVHGLEVGAAVKYRGVPVGRVGAILVAPDGRLVQVDLELEQGFRVSPGLRASLASSGITGVSVVELGFPPEGTAPPPPLTFTPPGRHIPSQPSLMAKMAVVLGHLAAGFREADLPGLVAEYRAAAVEARRRLAGPEVDRVLAGISGAADAFAALGRRLTAFAEDPRVAQLPERLAGAAERMEGAGRAAEGLFGDPRLAQVLEDARAATATLRGAAEQVRDELGALRAGERLDEVQQRLEGAIADVGESANSAAAGVRDTSAAATRAAARWERLAGDLDRSLQDVLARLEQAAAKIEGLAASVEANPSRLLAKPPKEDFR